LFPAGANGSGKSNIYEAIEFVLSEKFTGIRGDSRSKLLHEGAGKAVMSAYVELIFDNSDGRFPDDKKEVSLKRTLGVKKDEYFLNNKHVTKQEVDNMLESAGISRSNPYYIVRQGEVMKLIQMKTTERLELFKEIAGTRVYDERRKESAKIMQDTERRYTDIDEVISDLDSRLADLQGEKDELREFQQLDRERRCLEFNIYDHDLRKYTRALEEADAQRQRLAAQTAETHNQAMNVQDARAAAEDQLSELHQAVSLAQADRDRTQKEARDQRKRVAALEFKVKDREETATSMGSQRAALMTEQRTVQKEIDKAERSLTQTVRPQFETQKTAEATLSEELRRTQARQQTLYGKQGRVSQHKTKSERDASLKAECAQIEALVKQERKEQVSHIYNDLYFCHVS
jgi:structural maintenance of chromosome 3 (chondroitin sulfate proteoglycan 6)